MADTSDRERYLWHEIEKLLERVELQHNQLVSLEERVAANREEEESAALAVSMDFSGQPRPAIWDPPASFFEDPDPAVWPAEPPAPVQLVPPAGYANYSIKFRSGKVIAFVVFGLDAERLELMVDLVERKLRQTKDFRPVFLTDSTEASIFRRRGFVFEHFADHTEAGVCSEPAQWRYFAKRLELLKRKWGIDGLINLGQPMPELMIEHAEPALLTGGDGTTALDLPTL